MPDKVEIYRSRRGLLRRNQFRARVVAANGRILMVTPEGYNNIHDLVAITNRLFPNLERVGDPRDSGDVR